MIKCCFVFITLFFSSTGFTQTDSIRIFKKDIDSLNNYTIIFCNNQVTSKEINSELFSYKANYQFRTKSFIEMRLNLLHLFDTIQEYIDSNLRSNLEIEFPSYQFRVENKLGYSYSFYYNYKGEKNIIYRDCGCGFFKKKRISGGRFNGYNNQLFTRKVNFYLRYRYNGTKEYDFKIDSGLPIQFITYQDSNLLDKKITFNNGFIDSLESYYNNGRMMYKASITNGTLNGDFIYYDIMGNELLKVYFIENKVNTFEHENMSYEYSVSSKSWLPRYRVYKVNQSDRKW